LLASNNTQFNPAADLNGDGLIDNSDLVLLWQRLLDLGVDPDVLAAYQQIVGPPAAGYTIRVGDAVTLLVSLPPSSTPPLTFDWDLNGDGAFGDVSGAGVTVSWQQLNDFGITGEGVYGIAVRISDGLSVADLYTTLTVVQGGSAPG